MKLKRNILAYANIYEPNYTIGVGNLTITPSFNRRLINSNQYIETEEIFHFYATDSTGFMQVMSSDVEPFDVITILYGRCEVSFINKDGLTDKAYMDYKSKETLVIKSNHLKYKISALTSNVIFSLKRSYKKYTIKYDQ